MTLSADRVRTHTADSVLRTIDDRTVSKLAELADADPGVIAGRLDELDREWDSDRVVEAEAAASGLAGLALGALASPAFFAVTGVVAGAVLVHAIGGRYPLMPVFRRLGVRTAREIARERYALKALRGDFATLGARPEAVTSAAAPAGAPSDDGATPPAPVGM